MPDRYDAIVVLGAAVWPGGVPSPTLARRAETAIDLYRNGYAPVIVASGGVGRSPPAEAEIIRRIALENGVPAEAIRVEDRSRSTAENVLFSAELLRRLSARKIVVVTDSYHLLRATFGFRQLGFQPHGVAASSETHHTRPLRLLRSRACEMVALPYYWLKFTLLRLRNSAR